MPSVNTVQYAADTVVRLSDIVDQLSGKLTSAQIDDLLYSVISKRKQQVSPGDLITADLMNQVLRDLAALQAQVATLTAQAPVAGSGVQIDDPGPSTVARIGDPLVIRGQNLLADSVVMIENASIGDIIGSTGNTRLTIRQIPPIDVQGGIAAEGTKVRLQVINDAGNDETQFTLKPVQLTKPIGSIVIAVSDGPSGNTTFKAGGTYNYKFKISADTKPDDKYTVSASVGRSGWTVTPSVSVLDVPAAADARTPTVREVGVTVKIDPNANAHDTGHLVLTLTSQLDGTFVWRSTDDVAIEVEAQATPTAQLALTLTKTTAGQAAIRTNPDNSLTALIGAKGGGGGTGQISLTVSRADNSAFAAGDYQVDMAQLDKLKADSGGDWAVTVPGSSNGKVTLAGAKPSIKIALTAKATAAATKLVVDLKKADDATVTGHGEFAIECRT